MTFHLTCVHIIFSSVWVAEWPRFGKELLTRLTICSLCILTICYQHGGHAVLSYVVFKLSLYVFDSLESPFVLLSINEAVFF